MQRRDLLSAAALSLVGSSIAGCSSAKTPAEATAAIPQPEYVSFTLPVAVSDELDKAVVAAAEEFRDLLGGLRIEPITAKGSMGCCFWIGPSKECGSLQFIYRSGYIAMIESNAAKLYATDTKEYLAGIEHLKKLVRKADDGFGMLPLGLVTNFPVVR